MFVDYIFNGQASGPVGGQLEEMRFETGLLRPYIETQGTYRNMRVVELRARPVYNNVTGKYEERKQKVPVHVLLNKGYPVPMNLLTNAASMRKDAWIEMDRVVQREARLRLRAWGDLSAVSSYGGFNAMAKMTLEYEAMNDPGEAVVDMDALTDARTDSPLFKLRTLPLPITHSDFWYSERRLAGSRNTDTPLDKVSAEAAGRRVAETIEKTLIGVETGITFGPDSSVDTRYDTAVASKVYGYTNYPFRLLKTDLNTPTGTNPEAVMRDVIEMREQLYAVGMYGPFMVYTTPAYDQWLDDDYFRSGSTAIQRTLRERIESIEGVSGVRRLDFWTGSTYQILMVQMTSTVAQAINGMDITTMTWQSSGGLRTNIKVMAIQVPLLRATYSGVCGICHGTTS